MPRTWSYHPTISPTSYAWTGARRAARDLRHEIDQEAETYRVLRLVQPEGLPSWEIEVAYRPTGEVFCVRWWAAWVERVRRDAG